MQNSEKLFYASPDNSGIDDFEEQHPDTKMFSPEEVLKKFQYERAKADALLQEKAIFPEVSTRLENAARNSLNHLLGMEPPEDVHLIFIPQKETDVALSGDRNPFSNLVSVELSEKNTEILESGGITHSVINASIHELAHSYAHTEFIVDSSVPVFSPRSFDFTHSGFYGSFFEKQSDSGEKNPAQEIGMFMEEFFAMASADLATQLLLNTKDIEYGHDREPIIGLLDYLRDLTGNTRTEFLRQMVVAKTSPKAEQELRSQLESNNREGLYDVLMTLPWDGNSEYSEQIARGFEKVKEFVASDSPSN